MVNTYDVVIPQTRLEHAGIYVCRATAVYGEAFAQLVILGMDAVIACQLASLLIVIALFVLMFYSY